MWSGYFRPMRMDGGQWIGVMRAKGVAKDWICVELICVKQIYTICHWRVSLVDFVEENGRRPRWSNVLQPNCISQGPISLQHIWKGQNSVVYILSMRTCTKLTWREQVCTGRIWR